MSIYSKYKKKLSGIFYGSVDTFEDLNTYNATTGALFYVNSENALCINVNSEWHRIDDNTAQPITFVKVEKEKDVIIKSVKECGVISENVLYQLLRRDRKNFSDNSRFFILS